MQMSGMFENFITELIQDDEDDEGISLEERNITIEQMRKIFSGILDNFYVIEEITYEEYRVHQIFFGI